MHARHIVLRVVVSIAVLATSASLVGPVEAQEAQPERNPGIYVAPASQSTPQYSMVHAHSVADVQQSGAGKSMLTMGMTGISTTLTIAGAKAEQRLSSGDLVFLLQVNPMPGRPAKGGQQAPPDISAAMAQADRAREMPMGLKPDSLRLIQATVDGDKRRLELGSQGGKKILGGGRAPKDAVDFTVDKLGPETFRLKPKSPLAPGEYAFSTIGGSGMIWDFAVDDK